MERMFRMCMTLCFHRALSAEEIAGLPPYFINSRPRDFAGGPLETFLTKGIPELPTLQPCERPKKHYLDMDCTMYTVDDCGLCRPCKARLALSAFVEGLEWPLPERELYRKIEAYNKRLSRVQDIMVVEV
jgi:hypothetical protein